MARLSVEHYRANVNMTPDHTRKSSRFRDIFKSRSSLSPSTLDLSGKPPPAQNQMSPPMSPTSPTVKPGFERVGILPSERNFFVDATSELERHGGTHIAEVLAKQEADLKDVSVPHNVDTGLDVAHVGHQDQIVEQASKQEKETSANALAVAFNDAVVRHQNEEAGASSQADTGEEPKLRHRSGRQNLSVDENDGERSRKSSNQMGFFDLNAARSGKLQTNKSEPCPPAVDATSSPFSGDPKSKLGPLSPHWKPDLRKSCNGVFSDAGDETFVNTNDDDSSPRDSFASMNIFDNQDSLSKGIRDYVDSKVAEAMVAYDGLHGRKEQNAGKQAHITFKIDVSGLAKETKDQTHAKHADPKPKHIALWPIHDPVYIVFLQRVIVALYTLLFACFIGYSSFWRLLANVSLVVAALRIGALCEQCQTEDMLLVPGVVIAGSLQELVARGVRGIGKLAIEVLEEADVEVEEKAA